MFDPERDPGESVGDTLPTRSLLMEAMRRVDEIGHLRTALPAVARVAARADDPRDDVEAAVLARLASGPLAVSEVVAGVVADGRADDYDVLQALARLREPDRRPARLTAAARATQGCLPIDQAWCAGSWGTSQREVEGCPGVL